jgi:hypothetical protein
MSEVHISEKGFSPEELQRKLEDGSIRQIMSDETVDLAKGNRFFTNPVLDEIDFLSDGILHPIPEGAHHRLLDWASIEVAQRPDRISGKAYLHRAKHFKFGFQASEYMLSFCTKKELLEQMQAYAPHPYPDYTISFWTATQEGVAEGFISVRLNEGRHEACMLAKPWEGEKIIGAENEYTTRGGSDTKACTLTWLICDAFRLLLAQPGASHISAGGPPRAAIRKGKRVHFYSASESTINLDAAKRVIQHHSTGHGKMMPAYQYRAHPCHSGGTPGCEHFWIEIGGRFQDEQWVPDQQFGRARPTGECYHCGRRRWWRREGQRGNAGIGFVKQSYKLIKGDDD